jgi:Lactoylglutathione lyase and related lyases
MKIVVTSIFVEDQDRALEFYTAKLGFVKKHDVPMGKHRWITLVSPEQPDGVELLMKPNEHPAAKSYQKKISPTAFRRRCSGWTTSRRSISGWSRRA